MNPNLIDRLLIVLILLLAFGLRMAAIDQLPPGLSHDEAFNGVTAIQVLEGQRLIFFEINKGIEPLIIYLEALSFYWFGIGPVPLRLVNIMAGMLTVALVYPLTARLFNRRLALWAMTGLTVSFWAIFVSRLTLRAVTLPPLLMLTLYFFWRGLEPHRKDYSSTTAPSHKSQSLISNRHASLAFFVLSGLTAGVTMYTYLSSRFIPFIILIVFSYLWGRRQITRRHGLGIFVLFALWAIVLAPLANYYWANLDSFSRRADQVTTIPQLLNGDFGPMIENTLRTLGMFTFRGDETDRYNLDGRPVFDWVNGLLFYAGLGLGLGRLRRGPVVAGPAVLLLAWTGLMLLPDFITDDSPHFLRTIGALPPVYIFWALGVEHLGRQLKDRLPQPEFLLPALGFLLVFGTTLHTLYDYFGRWQHSAEARTIYGADIAEISRDLKDQRPAGGFPAISAEYYRDLDPFRFRLHFQNQTPFAIWFDGRQTLAFPPPQSDLQPRYFFAASAPPDETWLPFLQPLEAGQAFTLYSLPDPATVQQAWAGLFPPENTINVTVNDDLRLLSYKILGAAFSGGKFQVLLGWQALRTLPPDADYTFLVRLSDQQGRLWLAADGNGYPPGDWQPGVLGLQLLTFRLPGDFPPRTYQLTMEVIDRLTGQALPAANGDRVTALGSLTANLAATPRPINPDRLPNPSNVPLTLNSDQNKPTLRLRGYQVNDRALHPGDTLKLRLHWQVLQQPQQNYQLAFFLRPNKSVPTQGDSAYHWAPIEPMGGEWPTEAWLAGHWLQDRLDLPLETTAPAGQFDLFGQWLDPRTGLETEVFELGAIMIEVE